MVCGPIQTQGYTGSNGLPVHPKHPQVISYQKKLNLLSIGEAGPQKVNTRAW